MIISTKEHNLSGQLGKRTRYQMNNISQLLLDIHRKESQQQIIINTNRLNEEHLILPKVKIKLNENVFFFFVFKIKENSYSRIFH